MRDDTERERREETEGAGRERDRETARWRKDPPASSEALRKKGNGQSLPLIGTLSVCLPDCPPTDHVLTYDAVTCDAQRSDVQP